MDNERDLVCVTVKMPKELKHAFDCACVAQRVTRQSVIEALIMRWLEEQAKGRKE